jgi:copper chaperone CopZ
MRHALAALAAVGMAGAAHAQPKMTEDDQRISEAVKFHYVWAGKGDPEALKATLEKVKGVASATFVPNENSITVMFTGSLRELPRVEQAAAGSGVPAYAVSHGTVALSLKSEKGADKAGFFKELDAMEGVRKSQPREGGVDVVCNLEAVKLEDFGKLAEKFKLKAEVTSHENVAINTTGDKYQELLRQLGGVKGLVVIKIDNDSGVARCIGVKKQSSDDAIKKAVEKAGMKLNEVKRH